MFRLSKVVIKPILQLLSCSLHQVTLSRNLSHYCSALLLGSLEFHLVTRLQRLHSALQSVALTFQFCHNRSRLFLYRIDRFSVPCFHPRDCVTNIRSVFATQPRQCSLMISNSNRKCCLIILLCTALGKIGCCLCGSIRSSHRFLERVRVVCGKLCHLHSVLGYLGLQGKRVIVRRQAALHRSCELSLSGFQLYC